MKLKTKELVIPPELMDEDFNGNNKVVIRRISAPERWRITDEAAPTVSSSNSRGIGKVTVSKEIISISTCVKAVISAPWKINDNSEYLTMDWELQEWLFEQINDFNSTMLKKKENLNDSSLNQETETSSPKTLGEN